MPGMISGIPGGYCRIVEAAIRPEALAKSIRSVGAIKASQGRRHSSVLRVMCTSLFSLELFLERPQSFQ